MPGRNRGSKRKASTPAADDISTNNATAYIIECTRVTDVEEVDEDSMYVDADDTDAIDAEINQGASKKDGRWVATDAQETRLVFKSKQGANAYAAVIWAELQDDYGDWDLASDAKEYEDEEDENNSESEYDEDGQRNLNKFKIITDDGRVQYKRSQLFYFDPFGGDSKNLISSIITVDVLEAKLLP